MALAKERRGIGWEAKARGDEVVMASEPRPKPLTALDP
jgi:hypothetical protein